VARPKRVRTARGDKELSDPPPDFDHLDAEFVQIDADALLLRLYAPSVHRATAVGFRAWGPHNRFDHQRPGPDGRPTVNRGRGVLYGAPTLLCCAGEFFAETGEITVPGVRLARLTVKERLWLLDLRGTAANGAGTIPAISAVTQRSTTQAWARWWYEHPQLTGIDGLVYPASGSGQDAVALWERARGKVVARRHHHWPLDHPDLADELQVVSHRLRLPIAR
jgi:hypothetical protein